MYNLSYKTQGKGFPVIYLHGFCESQAIWADFVDLLPKNREHICIDMPGFGESKQNKNFNSIDEIASEVYLLIERLQIHKAIFIGHSLGGYVALALADAHPEKFAGLCLFHSTALADTEERKHIRNKTADFITKNGIQRFLEGFIPPLFYKGRREILSLEMEKVRQITMNTSDETAVKVTLAMRDRADTTHVLARADFPIIFITGKDDELLPLEANKPLFFLPERSTIHLLAKTGHMGMFERLKETASMVEGFLRSVVD